jgi:hypothetical protein
MAISRMQEPRQLYGLGSIVKKAVRGVKKIVKSPIGKVALLGGLGALGGSFMAGGTGTGLMRFNPKNLMALARGAGSALGTGGKFSSLGDLFRVGGEAGAKFSVPRMLMGGLGATAIAAPFFMGGGEDEEEEITETIDPAGIRQSAMEFYRNPTGSPLAFMPQKKYVQPNFYAADGGRAGYADGMIVEEDDEEEFIRTGAGLSRRQPRAFLQMGGGAAEQQAEQMLMAEYVKYKNKGGDMTFKQFVQAVMQQGQDQQTMMAADGGSVPDSSVAGYTTPAGYNKFDYPSGGKRVKAQEGGIMETEVAEEVMPLLDMGGEEKDYRETGGFVEMGRKERADDVPARLSKNEFVFTADAVRNAGGGDIDKGAEVMENLMNNLEAGGQVSEDSQGLEGAQAMYEQQQMLQSRMI